MKKKYGRNKLEEWHIKQALARESMNKKLIISLSIVYMSLCNIVFANYTISGAVQSKDGDPIKKGLITLVKESNGEEVDKTKVSRKGKFKLKKLSLIHI